MKAAGSDWTPEFARTLDADPMLLGWRGVRADRVKCTARIEGWVLEALRGTFYRNGSAVHERFGARYRQLFDGDGIVQAYRFDARGVAHRVGELVRAGARRGAAWDIARTSGARRESSSETLASDRALRRSPWEDYASDAPAQNDEANPRFA